MPVKDKKKVLVVDDDSFFRDVLKKCLENAGVEVMAAESVAQAQQGLPLFTPDFVLSDVQMPGASGIDLLRWMKKEYPSIPVVIMTGFSDLIDATSAAEQGAAAFLSKPFKNSDLISLLSENLVGAGAADSAASGGATSFREEDFMKVAVEDFIVGSQFQTPIFLRMPSGKGVKFLKIAHQGEDLSLERIRTYREKGVRHLYLRREDFMKYLGVTVRVAQCAAESDGLADEKKARLLRHTMELVQQQIFGDALSSEVMEHAGTIVETTVAFLSASESGEMILQSVQDISDELYAHSVAVSMLSSMIGRQIGWTSPRTLTKVSLAAILHDIGKKQLPSELLRKPKSQLTPEEMAVYETHPHKGMEILSEMESISSDIVQAVHQHHERSDGSGFPGRIPDNRINPISKVLAVADEFCHLYLKSGEREKKDPTKTLNQLVERYGHALSPEILVALFKVFNLQAPVTVMARIKKPTAMSA